METCKISSLYNLSETLAAELFQGLTYPWEALPKISAFICRLGESLDPEKYERRGNRSGLPERQRLPPQPVSTGRLLLTRRRKSVIVPLSAEMPLWEKELLWAIPQS